MRWRGDWTPDVTYIEGDVVRYGEFAYVATFSAVNDGPPCEDHPRWFRLGTAGPQGLPGMEGYTGPPGMMGEKGERGERGAPGMVIKIGVPPVVEIAMEFLKLRLSGTASHDPLLLAADATRGIGAVEKQAVAIVAQYLTTKQ